MFYGNYASMSDLCDLQHHLSSGNGGRLQSPDIPKIMATRTDSQTNQSEMKNLKLLNVEKRS